MTRFVLIAAIPSIALSQQSDTIVKDATAPRFPGGATLVQQAQIGAASGAAEYQFHNIGSVLAAKDGHLWVLDFVTFNTAQLRLYSAAGKFVRNVGRQGAGNGEYEGPTGLAQLPDGRVVLRDIRGNRVNVYRPNGDLDTVWTFPATYSWMVRGRDPIRADTAGLVWMPFTPNAAQQSGPPRFVWVRLNTTGAVVDTVWGPVMPDVPRASVTIVNGISRATVAPPFQPVAYVGLNPQGYLISAVTNTYALQFHLPPSGSVAWTDHDRVLSVRRDVPVVPILDEERQDLHSQMEWDVDRRPGTKSGPVPDVPRTKPYFDGVMYSEEGRVLAAVAIPSERYKPVVPEPEPGEAPARVVSWREPKRSFDVFEPDGSYVGRLDMLLNTRPASLRGNTLWTIYRDPDGVSYLRKYNVLWRQ